MAQNFFLCKYPPRTPCRYGFQPQRAALLIYLQAIILLWKGVPFYSPPSHDYQAAAAGRAQHPRTAAGAHFVWRPAKSWPWNAY